MHDFKALGIESEATRALLHAVAALRRGGYSAAWSHVQHLSELLDKGEMPELGKNDATISKALSLALRDRYSESQARALGDMEHKDPKQKANPNPTRPAGSTGTLPTGEPQFRQAGWGGEPVPAYSPDNALAEAAEARREAAGLSTDTTIRDLNRAREEAAHNRTPPPEAQGAPVERGAGQFPDPNAEDGGLGDEATGGGGGGGEGETPAPGPSSEPAPEVTPAAEEPAPVPTEEEDDGEEPAAAKPKARRAKKSL